MRTASTIHTYKVVTPQMRSLGLRANPTILTFSVGKWVASPKKQAAHADAGGIWSARTLGGARALVRYMQRHYGIRCRIFAAEIDRVLRGNSYRVQSPKIRLLAELPV